MINTFLYGIGDKDLLNELVKNLDVKFNIHCYDNIKKDISNIDLVNNNFSFTPIFTKKGYTIYKSFHTEFFQDFHKMILTRGLYKSTYFEIENEFAIFFHSFLQILIEKKVELVIFGAFPHDGPDYILYHLAKKLGLKTILFYQSIFPNKFFMMSDINELGKFDNDKGENKINLENVLDSKQSYINTVTEYNYQNSHLKKYNLKKFLSEKRKIKKIIIKLFIFLKLIKRKDREKEFLKNLNKIELKKNETKILLNSKKKKIYFPLHLQPEMATSLLSKEYNDQIYLLEKLSLIVNQDWIIIVKENPRQSSYQRGHFFFKRLEYLKNIVFVNSHYNSQDLVKNCDLVATGAGTVGWEALINSKKCLVFGNPWFQYLHGCLKFNDNLSINDIEKFINNDFDKKQFTKDLNSLIHNTYEGIVNDFYKRIHINFDEKKNSKVVTENIIKFIKINLSN